MKPNYQLVVAMLFLHFLMFRHPTMKPCLHNISLMLPMQPPAMPDYQISYILME